MIRLHRQPLRCCLARNASAAAVRPRHGAATTAALLRLHPSRTSRPRQQQCRPLHSTRSAAHPNHHPSGQRWSQPPSTATVTDAEIASLTRNHQHTLSLADLVRHGRPPLPADALFSSANFTLSLLPIRLAHRIQALRNLPFIVVSNPNISRIYNNYLHSLSTLLPWRHRTIYNLEGEIQFTSVLAELVQTHQDTIPILAKGFLECRRYVSPGEVMRFLDEHLRARIGTRLIAEQHIALHYSSAPHLDPAAVAADGAEPHPPHPPNFIGVIDTALRPADVVHACAGWVAEICEYKYGVRPRWVVEGEPDTVFAYVPMHLEYILTELLKNAFRATIENRHNQEPVVITIAPEPPDESLSSALASRGGAGENNNNNGSGGAQHHQAMRPLDDNAPGVTIRIRDRGGGIAPEILPNVWRYSFTTFSDNNGYDLPTLTGSSTGSSSSSSSVVGDGSSGSDALGVLSGTGGPGGGAGGVGGSSIAGLGYGLPLSRAYAEYFGGGINVQSLYGWGTDVYLRLKGVGRVE